MPTKSSQKRKSPVVGKKKREISSEVRFFKKLVDQFSYMQGPDARGRPLTNFTVWAGAGFSKSWDPTSPVGDQLFTLESKLIDNIVGPLALSRMFGGDDLSVVSPDQLRQIVYHLDMYEKYLDVRSRYADEQNIALFRAAIRAAVVKRFDEISGLNYLDETRYKFPLNGITDSKNNILSLFRHLLDCADGSQDTVEGIRCHFITTNYDFVIETILDNVLSEDESLFNYTYRGFTPKTISGNRPPFTVHEHWLAWHLLKINGGFEIFRNNHDYHLVYNPQSDEAIIEQPPVLILPSREQNYTDPYFRAIFPKAVRLLRETQVLLLVGYSLPNDDALIRFILRQFAEEAEDGRGKHVFYIDPNRQIPKRFALTEVLPSIHRVGHPQAIYYQGGFDDFAAEYAQLLPDHLRS